MAISLKYKFELAITAILCAALFLDEILCVAHFVDETFGSHLAWTDKTDDIYLSILHWILPIVTPIGWTFFLRICHGTIPRPSPHSPLRERIPRASDRDVYWASGLLIIIMYAFNISKLGFFLQSWYWIDTSMWEPIRQPVLSFVAFPVRCAYELFLFWAIQGSAIDMVRFYYGLRDGFVCGDSIAEMLQRNKTEDVDVEKLADSEKNEKSTLLQV